MGAPCTNVLHLCAAVKNRERLWAAVQEGLIDLVATDHSPCSPEWKRLEEGRFDGAWGGIASLSVALPVMWNGLLAHGMELQDLARLMAQRPAELAQLTRRKGR